MKKLYYDSAYQKEFTAAVLSCQEGKKGYEIILDQTAFYPEGGGQPADTGILGGVRVLDVHEKNGQIIHTTDGPLKEGTTVSGTIDWDRRFLHMQEHSGEHIVSGLIHARFGYDNVGFHMGSEEVTIDFNGILEWEDLLEVEREANAIIYDNREVYAGFPPKEELETLDYRSKKELTGDIRIVKIPGGDVCACCGTHVARTGEIGIVKFTSMIHYKGGVRIGLLCGRRALMDYEKKRDGLQKIAVLLSARPEEAFSAVERLKEELGNAQMRIGALCRSLIEEKVSAMEEGSGRLFVCEPDFEPVPLRQMVNAMLEKKKGDTVLGLAKNGENGYFYVLGSLENDMRPLTKELNGLLHGRGGGSMQMTQGTFYGAYEDVCAVLKEKGFNSPGTCSEPGAPSLSDRA